MFETSSIWLEEEGRVAEFLKTEADNRFVPTPLLQTPGAVRLGANRGGVSERLEGASGAEAETTRWDEKGGGDS